MKGRLALTAFVLGLVGVQCGAKLGEKWSLFADARVVQLTSRPKTWAFELMSSDSEGEGGGGIEFDQPNNPRFKNIFELSADFRALEGGVGGGSPRFAFGLDLNNNGVFDEGIDANIFAYFGPVETGFHQPPSDVWENTGNLIGTAERRWDLNQIGSTRYYDDYATALSMAGNYRILYVYLVIDSGWLFGDQIVQVNNVTVNNSTLVARKPQ